MKILYLTARQPYPVIKGDQIISYEQIKELSKENDIYLVTFYEDSKDIFLNEMNKYCKQIYYYKNSNISKLISLSKTIINFKPMQVNIFYKKYLQREIEKIYKDIKPDIVHIQSFRMAEYFIDKDIIKSIDLIDSYSMNMKKRAAKSKLLKWLWNIEYTMLKKYEDKILKSFKLKTLVSDRDKEYFNDDSIVVNNNGTSIRKHDKISERNDIIIHGNMSYYPNVEAVEYIKNELFDELKKINSDLKLFVVGGNPNSRVKKLESKDVIITGYVESIESYMYKSKVAIYPIFSATGMQNKVLESMGAGIPCIISEECFKGIPNLKHEDNVIVAKNKEDYIHYYNKLINDSEYYVKIRDNAFEFVVNRYSWSRNCDNLTNLWSECSKNEVLV